jgi:geranylgeranylglycerol-phosphate geranylgeranyltransferase
MIRRLLATVEIARPHNMLAAAACVFSGFFLSGGAVSRSLIMPLLFTALVTGLGNVINDYFDADIDRVNKPRRPIPSGRLSERYAYRVYWLGSVVVCAPMVFLLSRAMLVVMLIWHVLLYCYARRGKRVLLVGNILIGTIASSAFFAGALMAADFSRIWFPVVFAFIFVMGRELVKGAEDVEGDRGAGARTLAVRIGVEKTSYFATLLLIVCAVIAPIPGLVEYFGRLYVVMIEMTVVPGILLASYLVLKSPNRFIFNRASWILKIEMFFGIVAMSLARA